MAKKHSVVLRYLRMAPRKVRLVGDNVRGLSVNEAEASLLHMRQRAAKPMLKLLRSAVAGAKEKKLELEKLAVETIRVDQGPMLKRYLPRAMGRATPIQKKMSHVTITLAERETSAQKRFTIVTPKKVKPELRAKKDERREKEPQEQSEKPVRAKQQSGFLRKMFSRKAGFAK